MRPARHALAALAALTALAACAPRPALVRALPPPAAGDGLAAPTDLPAGDFAPRIPDAGTWRALAAAPASVATGRTEVVKVVIDLDDAWRVYFLQSGRWTIHYDFARRFLWRIDRPVASQEVFNRIEYESPDRHFILGQIAYYRDQDQYTFELVAGDRLDIPRTARAFQTVRALVHVGARLRYRPVPSWHEEHAAELRAAGLPVLLTRELLGDLKYQPLTPGEAYGYLRFFTGAPKPSAVRATDVVVLDGVPLDLPVCAGVITAELQAPLSHIAILSQSRGTPNMALRDAMTEPRLRDLEGKLVRLSVTPQDFSIEPATQEAAERAWDARRPKEPFAPRLSLRDAGLPDIRTLRLADLEVAGAKAAQLGELSSIEAQVPVPRAFALPFRAYHDHLARSGLDRELSAMLADPTFRGDPAARAARLDAFRARVSAAPVDPAVLRAVRARVAALFPGTRVRLRSSTNAEDLPGFTGAGLYRSVVIPRDFTDKDLEDGLREVWASVFSFQGFEERSYYRIDQARVAMAVLVQESIDDDVVNGVAITANPFNRDRPGHFINVQVAGREGGAVTGARAGEVPEQILYYTHVTEGSYERLSTSSLAKGAPVLRGPELVALGRHLSAIRHHFYDFDWRTGEAMDVEFILAGPERRLVFVQARPYTVRWAEPARR